jgi:hypothetical protein
MEDFKDKSDWLGVILLIHSNVTFTDVQVQYPTFFIPVPL